MDLTAEFDRQVATLKEKGYPTITKLPDDSFHRQLEILRSRLPKSIGTPYDTEQGSIPLVLVVKTTPESTEQAMAATKKDGHAGITKLFPHSPTDFKTMPEVIMPSSDVYVLVDVDRGRESINLPPSQALRLIKESSRSPLTIDEGIAIVTQFPEFLKKNNCFSLLASRLEKGQAVPAIWINGQRQPNLGWCWDGNPHTWLGSASAGSRIGLDTMN